MFFTTQFFVVFYEVDTPEKFLTVFYARLRFFKFLSIAPVTL